MRQDGKKIYEIIDIQYFGTIESYLGLIECSNAFFLPEKRYEKSLHLNRTSIYGPNGLIHLSVPLSGGRNQKGLMRDIRIADDGAWKRIHWRSIHDSYRKAPWFEELGWQVEELYNSQPVFLLDWNLNLLDWVLKVLKLQVDILAESIANKELMSNKKVDVSANKPSEEYPEYQQVFAERFGFKPNLSILDLLFCEGPASINYLQKCAAYKNNG